MNIYSCILLSQNNPTLSQIFTTAPFPSRTDPPNWQEIKYARLSANGIKCTVEIKEERGTEEELEGGGWVQRKGGRGEGEREWSRMRICKIKINELSYRIEKSEVSSLEVKRNLCEKQRKECKDRIHRAHHIFR